MQFTESEKELLSKVHEIGMNMERNPGDGIFILLSPYLDELMALLKCLGTTGITQVFMDYKGVMNVMRMIEDGAQQLEKNLKSA